MAQKIVMHCDAAGCSKSYVYGEEKQPPGWTHLKVKGRAGFHPDEMLLIEGGEVAALDVDLCPEHTKRALEAGLNQRILK